MKRLVVFALALSILAASSAADAQQPVKVYRIGLIGATNPSAGGHLVEAFRQGLRERGWIEGQNVSIEYRWAEGRTERLPGFAAEMVGLKVDVILAGTNPVVAAAKQATTTIPIVMFAADPVGSGFIDSLSRPGGNITGLTFDVTPDTFGKRLQLLKAVAPGMSRVAVIWDRTFLVAAAFWKATEESAPKLGVRLQSVEVRGANDLEGAFAAMNRERAGGLMVLAHPVAFAARSQIAALAAKNQLPAVYEFREFADAGGLMSYGVSFPDLARRAATYVDKIFKGAKPADLPVEQPTKLELVINLKTAKALGLTIPQSVLIRTDEVIR